MNNLLNISEKTWNTYQKVLPKIKPYLDKVDEVCEYNTAKVMQAFWEAKISESHFNETTGYGYNDIGRDAIEKVYSYLFKAEKSLVRTQFVSGSHALAKTLFALLRPNDILLSITGLPYDTLHEVIGIRKNSSSLISYGVKYEQIDLINNDFAYEEVRDSLQKKDIKVVTIQRSKGYEDRKSIDITKLEKVIKLIKEVSPKTIVMVDNCYCELVSKKEPIEVGADLVVGSLIKNLGGGISSNGGYVVGSSSLVDKVAESLYLPGEGILVGPSLGANKLFLQGLYFAPSVVSSALKTSILTSAMLEELGYKVSPRYDEDRVDIVTNIYLKNEKNLIKYCEGIQSGSAIDAFVSPIPSDMPGYDDKIIMASGSFTQGSSIELSCDGPIREPYIAFQQGGLTYESGKIGILKAIDNLIKE